MAKDLEDLWNSLQAGNISIVYESIAINITIESVSTGFIDDTQPQTIDKEENRLEWYFILIICGGAFLCVSCIFVLWWKYGSICSWKWRESTTALSKKRKHSNINQISNVDDDEESFSIKNETQMSENVKYVLNIGETEVNVETEGLVVSNDEENSSKL